MARPYNRTLTYMQLDVRIYDNKKIVRMETKFGNIGFSFAVKMMCRIGENGYYLTLDEDEIAVICKKVINTSIGEFESLLKLALDINLFDKNKYEKYKILTSYGLQQRYFDSWADKRWKQLLVIKEYMSNKLDLDMYNYTLCNLEGHIIKTVDRKKFLRPHKEDKLEPEPTKEEQKIADIHRHTFADVLDFMKVPYKDRDDEFKSTYTEEEFSDYLWLNQKINKVYDGLRVSTRQLSFPHYVEFINESSPTPSVDELDRAFKRMAEYGVQENTDIYLRLETNLQEIKKPPENTQAPPIISPPKATNGKGITAPVTQGMFKDDLLYSDILEFWAVSMIRNPLRDIVICQFINEMIARGEIDNFKIQYAAYKQYIGLIGRKFLTGIENFVDKKESEFTDGKWRNENWELKVKEYIKSNNGKNGTAKKHSGGNTPETYGTI